MLHRKPASVPGLLAALAMAAAATVPAQESGEPMDQEVAAMIDSRSEQIMESDDRFVLTGFFTGDDGVEFKHMELVYTRKR